MVHVAREILLPPILVLSYGACSTRNPAYCEENDECKMGQVCETLSHSCVSQTLDAPPVGIDALPPECDLTKPFGVGIEVVGLAVTNESDTFPTLTSDELTIYFSSTRYESNGKTHLYRAARASRDSGFSPVTRVESLVGEAEGSPAVSGDGNTIVFLRYGDANGSRLVVSTRANTGVTFPPGTTIPNADNVREPSITHDGSALYAANLSTGFIVRMPRVGDSFGSPDGVDTNIAASQTSPVSSDDLNLFLSARDKGIYLVHRDTPTSGWNTPSLLAEFGVWQEMLKLGFASRDGCRLYFSMQNGQPYSRIFMAKRPK